MPRTYFLPQILDEQAVGSQAGLSQNTRSFIEAWMRLLGERAGLMRMSDKLNACAFSHATYLDSRTPEEIEALPDDGHGSHIGVNGSTPNQRVRESGYALPASQGDGNTVEFNVRTSRGPARALELYMGSDAHRPALMGEGFWQPATVFGIGQFGDDWVVLLCPPEEVL